jgi:hypothetical protein
VGALLAVGAGVFLLGRGPRGAPVAPAPSAASEARAVIVPPAPVPVAPVAAPAVPAAPAPKPAAAVARPHTRPVHLRGKHRRRAAAASAKRAGALRANCVPPFTIGPDGVKQYKIECL